MPGYFEVMTFAAGPVDIKELTAAKEYFVGKVVSTEKVVQDTAAAAKGVDWGSDKGMYRVSVMCDIKTTQKIAITRATNVEFRIYDSADDTAFGTDPVMTHIVPISLLNEARKTPICFSFLSTTKRYFCMSFKFTGGSATTTDKATAGQLLITANPSVY